jgi:hypothetical protein
MPGSMNLCRRLRLRSRAGGSGFWGPARVLDAPRRKPEDGSTRWSVRKLARELNLSKDMVHRIWRAGRSEASPALTS